MEKETVIEVDKTMITSPLEDIFGIKTGSTESFIQPLSVLNGEIQVTSSQEPIEKTDIDREAMEREEQEMKDQMQNVYDHALGAFEAQSMISQTVDPKFSARNAEVAAQYLNIALHAATSKADYHFKLGPLRTLRNGGPTQQANTINNNILVADRNEILKALSGVKKD